MDHVGIRQLIASNPDPVDAAVCNLLQVAIPGAARAACSAFLMALTLTTSMLQWADFNSRLCHMLWLSPFPLVIENIEDLLNAMEKNPFGTLAAIIVMVLVVIAMHIAKR